MKKIFKYLLATGMLMMPLVAFAQTVDFGTNYLTSIGLATTDIRVTIVNLIRVALGILGVVVLVIIVAAGFRWMTAGGNDDAISQSKKIISAAVIGLIIIIISYAITTWIMSSILEAAY